MWFVVGGDRDSRYWLEEHGLSSQVLALLDCHANNTMLE